MKIDVIGSIILTLILMLVAHVCKLDTFECILLMLIVFLIINYKHVISGFWYNVRGRLERKVKKEVKSSYEDLKIDEE